MNRKHGIPAHLVRTLLFLPLALSTPGCDTPSPETHQRERRHVEVYRVRKEEIQGELEGFGNLSFCSKADVTAAVEGTIVTLYCDEGDRVRKDQLLAEMRNVQLVIRREQAEASMVSAEAALELARVEYREGIMNTESRLLSLEKSYLRLEQKGKELEHQLRILENKRELYDLGGLPEEEMSSLELSYISSLTDLESLKKDIAIQNIGFRDSDIRSFDLQVPEDPADRKSVLLDINTRSLLSRVYLAEAGVRSARTELESAEALLEEMELRAPLDGIIGTRFKETGERVSADTKVFTIFDSSRVYVILPVPEEIGVCLAPGMSVDVSVDAVRGTRHEAEVRRISPVVDPQSGNITVKAMLENPDGLFLPGMFTRFHLAYGNHRPALRIPVEALVNQNEDTAIVFHVLKDRAYPRDIILGDYTRGLVEVMSGLSPGDTIILNPSPLLREGEEIYVP